MWNSGKNWDERNERGKTKSKCRGSLWDRRTRRGVEGEPRSDGNLEHKIGIKTNGGDKVGTGGLGVKERRDW